jgi:PAS domain S-box-containing protein
MIHSPQIGLTPERFAAAFPFHLAFDRSFTIRQIGRSMAILCPGLTSGSRLFDQFLLYRPVLPLVFSAIEENAHQPFVLGVPGIDIRLRGQMIPVPESDLILFLCSPWLTEPAQIGQLGLSLGSFAVHDATVDLLQVMQAQNTALADTRRLADRLSRQRSELRQVNDALTAEIAVRRQTEEELREREATFQTLLESASEAIVIVTEQGIIEMVNARTVSMFGHSREELLGQTVELLIPERLTRRHVEHRSAFMTEPRNRPMGSSLDLVGVRKDGSEFPIDISLSYIRTQRGLLVMGFVSDITERRQTAAELSRAHDHAVEASRLKSEFLATMSHEIRTPMNSIIGLSEFLLETRLDEEQEKFAKLVHESGHALLDIINDILDTSKIEAGKLVLERIDFDLGNVIEVVLAMLDAKAREKGIALTSVVAPAIPRRFHGDPVRLRQVLLNLVSNAVKFTHQGEVVVEVGLANQATDATTLRFNIRDTGIGIPETAQRRLFEPFSQADGSTSRKYGGTGLGLAISRKLVEMMGGAIGMESQEGEGSTFWFTVPLQIAVNSEPSSQTGERVCLVSSAPDTGTPRILLAEDNEVNSMIALRMLDRTGYRADRVTNGREAVEAAQTSGYRLILMDCQMPEMDGFDATRAIRAGEGGTGRRITIVAMTANAMTEDRDRCLAAGMDDYLSKPVDRRELAAILERWLT